MESVHFKYDVSVLFVVQVTLDSLSPGQVYIVSCIVPPVIVQKLTINVLLQINK